MKKIAVLVLSSIFFLLLVSSVFAAGWHTIVGVTPAQHDPDAGKWAASSGGDAAKVPHLGLQASTNACKACHAVHEGASNSFKLLQNSTRVTECDFCHASAGALTDPTKKPYTVSDPWGEHSLGTATMLSKDTDTDGTGPDTDTDGDGPYTIPQASAAVINSNSITDVGLSCGNCHSVHNAYSLYGNGGSDLVKSGTLSSKLLKRDPAGNDGDVLAGVTSVEEYETGKPPAEGATGSIDELEVLSTFCADCHNKNMNWDRGPALDGEGNALDEGERPNGFAHILGKGTDGVIDVYGELKPVTAQSLTSCAGCHTSRGQTSSRFPHQSRGHKLFGTAYRGDAYKSAYLNGTDGVYGTADDLYISDPLRTLPALDNGVCRTCHGEIAKQVNWSY